MELELGSWNVRTLLKPGAQRNLLDELKKYGIKIAAIQETRWPGQSIRDTRTHTILQSGKLQGNREFGVAFIIDRSIKHSILDFQAVSERICALRIKTKFFNISFINVHCPTEDKNRDIKEQFYQQLERVYDNTPKNDIKIVIGDMNAQIGREEGYVGIIGKHSLHSESNENGEMLIDFAASKNMIVSSTCFPHRDIHKATWISPDGLTANQIDNLLIERRGATSILDVKARRGASCGTDHFLLQARFRSKIQKQQRSHTQRSEKIDLEKLKDQRTREKYESEVSRKMQSVDGQTMEELWEVIWENDYNDNGQRGDRNTKTPTQRNMV
nr:PREDICTED: craniofacial development protein 2-like [Linepithema humile]